MIDDRILGGVPTPPKISCQDAREQPARLGGHHRRRQVMHSNPQKPVEPERIKVEGHELTFDQFESVVSRVALALRGWRAGVAVAEKDHEGEVQD